MTTQPIPHEASTERYAKNLQHLPTHVTTQLAKLDHQQIWQKFDVVHTPTGQPICRHKEHGRLTHVNRFDPLEQARQWSALFPLHMMRTVLLFGCGFGYALRELAEKTRKDSQMLVFERDIHLFAAMLHYVDLSTILPRRQFTFFVGDVQDFAQAFLALTSTTDLYSLTAPSILFAPEARLFKDDYLQIQRKVFNLLTQKISKLGNLNFASMPGFHNIVDDADTFGAQDKGTTSGELQKYREIYRALATFAAARRTKCEQMFSVIEQRKIFEVEGWVKDELKHNDEGIFRFLAPELHTAFFQQIVLYGCHQMNKLGAIHTAGQVRDAIAIHYETFDHLQLICRDLAHYFRDVMNRLAQETSCAKLR
jgi:hypothetical protein